MPAAPATIERTDIITTTDEEQSTERPWNCFLWNDPVNLMPYVAFVLQKVFGFSKEKSQKVMLEAHKNGKVVVSTGTREKVEVDAQRLHSYTLQATIGQDK